MSTVAEKCAARVRTCGRVGRWCGGVMFCAGLAFAAQLIERPCQAQSAPAQSATPPEAPPDPPPSLTKHPKPASTPAPAAQPPAGQSDGTQNPAGQSGASAAASTAQNPPPSQSSAPSVTGSAALPTAAGDASTPPAQPSNSGQSSTGAESPAQPPAATPSASSGWPAAAVPVSDSVASAPEINTRTTTVPLESHANLVPVRVVVHDSTGHAVENLQKDDFQVKQDGRLQFITHFSVETPGSAAKQVARGEAIAPPPDPNSYSLQDSTAGDAGKPGPAPAGALAMPSRFVALLFDDAHLNTGDLTRSKLAAMRFIDSSVKPNQRLAVFTVSGRNQVDFTDDHAAIRDVITHMISTPAGAYDPTTEHDCLQISYYQADLIQNKNDSQALAAATEDALACAIVQRVSTG